MPKSIWFDNLFNYITALLSSADIDEKLDKRDLYMVKISDEGAADEYGIEDIPALVYFENGVPEIFTGQSGSTDLVAGVSIKK